MSKLVLYSDQIVDVSEKVDEALLRLIGKGSPMVAFKGFSFEVEN